MPLTAERLGGIYAEAADLLSRLLASTDRTVPLHGDLHHGNLLDGGARSWLAIDPKGLMGDPTYDYAIMLCLNPDAPTGGPAKAADVARRVPVVAAMAGLSTPRLLAWTTCLCALYSAWFEGHEGVEPWAELTFDRLRDFADQMGIT